MLISQVKENVFLLPLGKIVLSGRYRRLPRWSAILPSGQIVATGFFGSSTIFIDYLDDGWVVVVSRWITIERK